MTFSNIGYMYNTNPKLNMPLGNHRIKTEFPADYYLVMLSSGLTLVLIIKTTLSLK